MKPLIKLPGGKLSEIKFIEEIMPTHFKKYIEPFFGGGAVFFKLEPKKAIINDVNRELMLFYKYLKDGKHRKKFEKELYEYVNNWERVNEYMKHFGNSFIVTYNLFKKNKIDDGKFAEEIKRLFREKIVPFNGLFSDKFCVDRGAMLEQIQENVIAKLRRVKYTVDTENHFSDEEIMKNLESAFRSGFYIHFRGIMNKAKKGLISLSDEKRVANYYFVREFCYGSMFRFNQSGDFNIPYGGIAYNKKDFRKKINTSFSDKVKKLFENTVIENMDFEDFLKKHKPNKNDFVFLDPPYDTEFSEYEENPFTKKDQERLANCIMNLKSKFILIIKETHFILELYRNNGNVKILSFGKKYLYNIRGRNVREVKHLIIHNLKETQSSLNSLQ